MSTPEIPTPSAFKQAEMGTARVDACLNATVRDNEEERANIYALARTLERELNEAMLEVEAVRELAGYNDLKSQLAALTAERDELKNADWQLHIRLKERGDIFFGDQEGHYVSRDKLAALQEQVEALEGERDAARQHHKEEAASALNKIISAETALANATRQNEGLAEENTMLRADNDKRIRDFLNEKQCCDGAECGCHGVTRMQQMVSEEFGERFKDLRQQLTAALSLVEQLKGLLHNACGTICEARLHIQGRGVLSSQEAASCLVEVENGFRAALILPADHPKQEKTT